MSDILIRGMEMPSGCSVCKLSQYGSDTNVCPFCGDVRSFSDRHERCPLDELPPHGDLIDREWLKELAWERKENFGYAFVDALDIAITPTVIPASKGESE